MEAHLVMHHANGKYYRVWTMPSPGDWVHAIRFGISEAHLGDVSFGFMFIVTDNGQKEGFLR